MSRSKRTAVVLSAAVLLASCRQHGRLPHRLAPAHGPRAGGHRRHRHRQASTEARHAGHVRPRQGGEVAGGDQNRRPHSRRSRTCCKRGLISDLDENEPLTEASWRRSKRAPACRRRFRRACGPMSVKVNEVVGVAGFVVPGTRVDVMVTLTSRQQNNDSHDPRRRQQRAGAHGRHALRPGEGERGRSRFRRRSSPCSVTPDDAERIALAASEGQIMLALRNPLDTTPTVTTGVGQLGCSASRRRPPAPKPRSPGERAGPVKPEPVHGGTGAEALHRRSRQGRQAHRGSRPMNVIPDAHASVSSQSHGAWPGR